MGRLRATSGILSTSRYKNRNAATWTRTLDGPTSQPRIRYSRNDFTSSTVNSSGDFMKCEASLRQHSKYDFFGTPVVVDKKSELYLEDAKLDFINGLERSGFHLDLPMAKKTCGCGSSYQF